MISFQVRFLLTCTIFLIFCSPSKAGMFRIDDFIDTSSNTFQVFSHGSSLISYSPPLLAYYDPTSYDLIIYDHSSLVSHTIPSLPHISHLTFTADYLIAIQRIGSTSTFHFIDRDSFSISSSYSHSGIVIKLSSSDTQLLFSSYSGGSSSIYIMHAHPQSSPSDVAFPDVPLSDVCLKNNILVLSTTDSLVELYSAPAADSSFSLAFSFHHDTSIISSYLFTWGVAILDDSDFVYLYSHTGTVIDYFSVDSLARTDDTLHCRIDGSPGIWNSEYQAIEHVHLPASGFSAIHHNYRYIFSTWGALSEPAYIASLYRITEQYDQDKILQEEPNDILALSAYGNTIVSASSHITAYRLIEGHLLPVDSVPTDGVVTSLDSHHNILIGTGFDSSLFGGTVSRISVNNNSINVPWTSQVPNIPVFTSVSSQFCAVTTALNDVFIFNNNNGELLVSFSLPITILNTYTDNDTIYIFDFSDTLYFIDSTTTPPSLINTFHDPIAHASTHNHVATSLGPTRPLAELTIYSGNCSQVKYTIPSLQKYSIQATPPSITLTGRDATIVFNDHILTPSFSLPAINSASLNGSLLYSSGNKILASHSAQVSSISISQSSIGRTITLPRPNNIFPYYTIYVDNTPYCTSTGPVAIPHYMSGQISVASCNSIASTLYQELSQSTKCIYANQYILLHGNDHTSYYLYNLRGAAVLSHAGNISQLDVTRIPSGTYFLLMKGGGHPEAYRIVITR